MLEDHLSDKANRCSKLNANHDAGNQQTNGHCNWEGVISDRRTISITRELFILYY